jgi:hypothetical protein
VIAWAKNSLAYFQGCQKAKKIKVLTASVTLILPTTFLPRCQDFQISAGIKNNVGQEWQPMQLQLLGQPRQLKQLSQQRQQ